MNENQLAPCWEFQPYLAENYVRHLLAEIANVLEQLYYHKHALDSNWSEGVGLMIGSEIILFKMKMQFLALR